MRKGQHAAKPGKRREKIITFRIDLEDGQRLEKRRLAAGARSMSAYLRRVALTGAQLQMPSFETLRDLRNEIIQLGADVKKTPSGKKRDQRLDEAIFAALERISRF